MFNNDRLDVVDDFDYLGVWFNFIEKFAKIKKSLTDQARNPVFSSYEKVQKTV